MKMMMKIILVRELGFIISLLMTPVLANSIQCMSVYHDYSYIKPFLIWRIWYAIKSCTIYVFFYHVLHSVPMDTVCNILTQ